MAHKKSTKRGRSKSGGRSRTTRGGSRSRTENQVMMGGMQRQEQ